MVIIKEATQSLVEILQPAGSSQLQTLKKQMTGNDELTHTLTTPINYLPQYKYLVEDGSWVQNYSLIEIMDYTIRKNSFESYFMKTSKGIYVGFIALWLVSEKENTFVKDIKFFSFGLSPKEDENMICKDVPALLDKCLKKYSKVMWTALKANKANIAYEIYRRRHKGKKEDLGNAWRYTCCK